VVGAHLDPAWAGRLLLGEGLAVMTGARGAATAKRELGWSLRYLSWRQGFPAACATPSRSPQRPDPPWLPAGTCAVGPPRPILEVLSA